MIREDETLLALGQRDAIIQKQVYKYGLDFGCREESSRAAVSAVSKVQRARRRADPLVLLASVATLLLEAVVTETVELVQVLVVGRIVRHHLDRAADVGALGNHGTVGKSKVCEKNT